MAELRCWRATSVASCWRYFTTFLARCLTVVVAPSWALRRSRHRVRPKGKFGGLLQ